MAKTVRVNDACIGCGMCEGMCPSVFEIVDGVAVAKFEDVPEDLEAEVEDTAASCPAQAIEVE